ncbi:MAG: hypothetical protein WC473_02460 [Patescibacteria group bacterium]|jgi:hypothetical protein
MAESDLMPWQADGSEIPVMIDVACPQARPVGGHGAMLCRLNGKECRFSFDYPHVLSVRDSWRPPEEITPILEVAKKTFGVA